MTGGHEEAAPLERSLRVILPAWRTSTSEGVGKAADEAAKSERMAVNFILRLGAWVSLEFGWSCCCVRNDWNASEMKNAHCEGANTSIYLNYPKPLPFTSPIKFRLTLLPSSKHFLKLATSIFWISRCLGLTVGKRGN